MTLFFLASQDNDTIVRVEGLVTKVAGRWGPKPIDEFVSGQEMTEHSGWVTVRDPGLVRLSPEAEARIVYDGQ